MYVVQIQNGDNYLTIYETGTAGKNRALKSASIVKGINTIDSFNFTILPDNDGFYQLVPMSTKVVVYNTQRGKVEFAGRVLTTTPEMDTSGLLSKSVVCESRLGYLCDSIQPYTAKEAYVLEDYLALLLQNHNAIVEEDKCIQPGTVALGEEEIVITRELNYKNTWQELTLLIGEIGGEVCMREEKEEGQPVLYLDYVKRFGTQRTTTIELGKNLKSIREEDDISNIITRLIPLGAKVEGNERLTIAQRTGKPYVDSGLIDTYGVVVGVQIWDEIDSERALEEKALNWLNENNRILRKCNVSALDLSLLGLDYDDFEVYDTYPVEHELLNISNMLRVIKKTMNLLTPQASGLEFGERWVLQSDLELRSAKKADEAYGMAADVRDRFSEKITELDNKVLTQYSEIMQDSEGIVTRVVAGYMDALEEEIDRMRGDFSTEITQTARSIRFDFEEMLDDTQRQLNEDIANIHKYIQFEDGDIILGEAGSPYQCRITNQKISFLFNGNEVSFFSGDDMFIKHGNVVNELSFGRMQADAEMDVYQDYWRQGVDAQGGFYLRYMRTS